MTLTSDGAAATAPVTGSPYAIVPAMRPAGPGQLRHQLPRGSLTVDPRRLTITANDATKTYGDTLTFAGTEFTTSGLVNGDAVDQRHLDQRRRRGHGAVTGSPYAIAASGAAGSGLGNYTISYVDGS